MSKKKTSVIVDIKQNSINEMLFWCSVLFIVLFLFISPYYKGLFNGGSWIFDGPIYKTFLFSTIMLLLFSLRYLIAWNINKSKDILNFCVWLIPFSGLISLIQAASIHSSIKSVYIMMIYIAFFMIGNYLSSSNKGLNIVTNAFVISGYTLVIYGLLNWFGNASFQDAVLENRLAGVFQYPNTYAAFLICLLFSSLILAMASRRAVILLLHSIMFVPIFLSFLLTVSRGGMLVFPIVLLIFLLMLPFKKQLLYTLIVVTSGVASLAIFKYVESFSDNNQSSLLGWLVILLATFIVSIIVFLVKMLLEPSLKKENDRKTSKYLDLIIPILLIVILLGMLFLLIGGSDVISYLPGPIKERIESSLSDRDSSVISRTTFFADSVKIIKDYPIIGAGGGAWSILYPIYKSYPYISQQAHNFPLQYMLEFGILGIFLLFVLFLYIFIKFVYHYKNNRGVLDNTHYDVRLIFFIVAVSFLIHSFIDFDMSYIYVGAIVFLSFGGMTAYLDEQVKQRANKIPSRPWTRLLPIITGIVSIVMMFISIKAVLGNTSFETAIRSANNGLSYEVINSDLNQALKYQPNHIDYVITKISITSQAYQQSGDEKYFIEAISLLEKFRQKEPNNRIAIDLESNLYIMKDDLTKAYETYENKMHYYPWDIQMYERMIGIQFELGMQAKESDLELEKQEHWNKAMMIYHEVNKKIETIESLPKYKKSVSNNFKINRQMALAISKIHLFNNEYKESTSLLSMFTNENFSDPISREVTRLYFVSIFKQEIENEAYYEKFINYHPEESQKIKELMEIY